MVFRRLVEKLRPTRSLERQLELIRDLDLGPIAYKLVHPERGEVAMTIEEAERLIVKYRNFLKLYAMYPTRSIVPTKEMDPVWHAHILDTAKYREDCQAIFGRPLDHFPYLGMRGEEDKARLDRLARETHELYLEAFGVPFCDGPVAGNFDTSFGVCEINPDCKGGSGDEVVRPRLPLVA